MKLSILNLQESFTGKNFRSKKFKNKFLSFAYFTEFFQELPKSTRRRKLRYNLR